MVFKMRCHNPILTLKMTKRIPYAENPPFFGWFKDRIMVFFVSLGSVWKVTDRTERIVLCLEATGTYGPDCLIKTVESFHGT